MTEQHPGFAINCIDLVELVTEYLEGTLDHNQRATIDAHLEICPHCAEYIEQMRLTVASLGHVPLEPALQLPHDVQQQLLDAFRAEPQ
jgi:anti-sigma factor ChrR (cupin superfamily)